MLGALEIGESETLGIGGSSKVGVVEVFTSVGRGDGESLRAMNLVSKGNSITTSKTYS